MREKGFAPILVVVIVAVAAIGLTSAAKNSENVQGTLIARGGDDSDNSGSDSDNSGSDNGDDVIVLN